MKKHKLSKKEKEITSHEGVDVIWKMKATSKNGIMKRHQWTGR